MLATFGETVLQLSSPRDRLAAAHRLRVAATGPESNAAIAARALGTDARWYSVLPDSSLGERVVRELRGYDIDTRVTYRAGRQGLSFVEPGAAPREPERVEDRAGSALARAEEGDLTFESLEAATGAYVTGATPGISTPLAAATARFLKGAHDAGAHTAFGLHYRPERWAPEEARETLSGLFPAVDTFIAHRADVATVFDRDGPPAEAANALAAAHGFDTVVLVGRGDVTALAASTLYEASIPEGEVVDTTGADDALAGAFLAARLQGAGVERALRHAAAACALARSLAAPVPDLSRASVERVARELE
ncbi:PfkB family carbohydrate kinase [Natronomonas sp. EA1]|uniref:PfkB family carbohydrate kinase n=1 Tax=Natronomonas sp. EA1 TaxID=3421655 RepID=UPI003EBCAFC0